MQRIQAPGNVSTKPALTERTQSPGYFHHGDPANGQQATLVTADWLNMVQEELVAIVTAAGIALNAENTAQVRAAIEKLIQNGSTSLSTELKALISTAQSTANTAKTNAATAQSTANTAKTNAATAQSTVDTLAANVCANNAAAHNAIYRGKNLTSIYTLDQLSAKVAAGDFSDLFIGDYIEKSITSSYGTETVRFLFAGFDTYINKGDTAFTKHHIAMVPEDCFANSAQMNATNTTEGGLKGSAMWTTVLPAYATALTNAFGSHLATHRYLITNAVNTSLQSGAGAGWGGASSGWEWVDAKCRLMSEVEVYGTRVFSSSFHDVGAANNQLPLFRLAQDKMVAGLGLNSSRADWWLGAVASGANFARVASYGHSSANYASDSLGVRPVFLFV